MSMRRNPNPTVQKVYLHRKEIGVQVIMAKKAKKTIQILADQFNTIPHIIKEAVEVFCRKRNYRAFHKAEGNLAKARQNKIAFLSNREIKKSTRRGRHEIKRH